MRARPMNPDLKWLAMNVDTWEGSAEFGYIYMIFDGYEVDYAKRPGKGRFTYRQWHDARISLGLEGQPPKKWHAEADMIIAAVCAVVVALVFLLTGAA